MEVFILCISFLSKKLKFTLIILLEFKTNTYNLANLNKYVITLNVLKYECPPLIHLISNNENGEEIGHISYSTRVSPCMRQASGLDTSFFRRVQNNITNTTTLTRP